MIIIYMLLWWLSGFASFTFWWTTQHDMDIQDALFGVMAGLLGPLSFPLGWLIHGSGKDMVLIKRRGK